jgi:hypothetical protein
MERPSNGRFGCAAILLVVSAFSMVPAAVEIMRGAPLAGSPQWREAQGGEPLNTGGRAAPGDMIRTANTSWEISDEFERLIFGAVAAALGIVVLALAIRDRRAWKRRQGGGD